MGKLTHIDKYGNATMVDVSDKKHTDRMAVASGSIRVSREVIDAVITNQVKKGDVLGTARIAGIMAAKKTPELIPLCHTLLLSKVALDFEILEESLEIKCICTVKLNGQTGAEMEALTGVSTALLTVYDMCKAIDKTMVIGNIRLEEKSGGKSGHFVR
ncbi:MAG: cyclic pyranopterin monophosphate synthase MoaC [Lachnospiraceae bacterium]|nr:cyclic pyranopterin monophosphate synthase MoaC [Lachnospiraceae bacterium]